MSVQFKKFHSPNSFVRRVALLSGHIYEVGFEWQLLPEFAWSAAYAAGCVSEDMSVNNNIPAELLKALSDEAGEMEAIKTAILEAIEFSVHNAFKKDGSPNLLYLSNKLNHRVDHALVDKVWFRIQNGE